MERVAGPESAAAPGDHGAPGYGKSDNGPECMAQQVTQGRRAPQSETRCIAPGSPWQNGHNERWNPRSRSLVELADFRSVNIYYGMSPGGAMIRGSPVTLGGASWPLRCSRSVP
jgi:hypothetical protein